MPDSRTRTTRSQVPDGGHGGRERLPEVGGGATGEPPAQAVAPANGRTRSTRRIDWKALAHFFGDQLVYRWNMAGEASPDVTLHEFMGLTWEQYAAWVEGRYGEVLPDE